MRAPSEKHHPIDRNKIQSVLLLVASFLIFIFTSWQTKADPGEKLLFENFVLRPSCILQFILCLFILFNQGHRSTVWIQLFVFIVTLCFFLADIVMRIGV